MRLSETKVMQWVDSDNVYAGIVILDEKTNEEVVLSREELDEIVERADYFISHFS